MKKYITIQILMIIFTFSFVSSTLASNFELSPDLELGITNPFVIELQKFLNSNGYVVNPTLGQPGSIGYESNYFGKMTQKALSLFQSSNNINPASGYFGPKTKNLAKSFSKKGTANKIKSGIQSSGGGSQALPGPNGTHWPNLIPTPFMYDDTVAHTIEVEPTWAAIKTAFDQIDATKANQGVRILVRRNPGTEIQILTGQGSGLQHPSVLANVGSSSWNKRVTIAPKDGYGTVFITDGFKFNNVKNVAFAGFASNGGFYCVDCDGSALAWTRLGGYSALHSLTAGSVISNFEFTEVAWLDAVTSNGDVLQIASDDGHLRNLKIEGLWMAPHYYVNDTTPRPHTDTLQIYRVFPGTYQNMNFTIKDSVLFASNNAALQTGGTDGITFDNNVIIGGSLSKEIYPVTPNGEEDGGEVFSAINGAGTDWTANKSYFYGPLQLTNPGGNFSDAPFVSVSNSAITETQNAFRNPEPGSSWDIVSLSNKDFFTSKIPAKPTPAYLTTIWSKGGTPPVTTPDPGNPPAEELAFAPGNRVKTIRARGVSVRIEPKISAETLLGTQPLNATGIIVGGPEIVDDIVWWNVNYSTGFDGWVGQDTHVVVEAGVISSNTDTDQDGVPDLQDKCQNTKPNIQVNTVGCPPPVMSVFTIKPDINQSDLTRIQNFYIGKTGKARIDWGSQTLNLQKDSGQTREPLDLDQIITIEEKTVTVNSQIAPVLDKPATITLYNINPNARILRNGGACDECTNVTYDSSARTLTFTVPGFSTYTVVEDGEQYTLTTSVSGQGSISGNAGQYADSSTATITANPSSGYTFSGWSGVCSGSNTTCTVVMNGDKTTVATFIAEVSVSTPTSSGGGGGGGGGGGSSKKTKVEAKDQFQVSCTVSNTKVGFGSTVSLDIDVKNASSTYTYKWSGASNALKGFDKTKEDQVFVIPNKKKTYTLTFTATNKEGKRAKVRCDSIKADKKYNMSTDTQTSSMPNSTSSTDSTDTQIETLRNRLTLGQTSEDVRTLQKLLNQKGYIIASSGTGSPGNESTYFGEKTKQAITRYLQAKQKTPAVAPALIPLPSSTQTKSTISITKLLLTKNLSPEQTDSEVLILQKLLNQKGYIIASSGTGSPGNESTYFGEKTKQAVKRFQQASGIPADGWAWQRTRDLLNK